MQVILLEKIGNLGNLGELVVVKPGFARNYLLPSGKAKMATPANIEDFEKRRAEFERQQADQLDISKRRAEALEGARVTVYARAGNEGKLFGSVGTEEIAKAFVAAGKEVEKREVRLPDGPLRNLGEHELVLHIHSEIDVQVLVDIEPEAE